MADNAITQGGIGVLGSPFYICGIVASVFFKVIKLTQILHSELIKGDFILLLS